MSRRFTCLLVALFTCLGLAAGGGIPALAAASAQAGPSGGQQLPAIVASSGVPASTAVSSNYVGAAGVIPDVTGTICYVRIDNPHQSTHNPGQINVVASVDCTAPVTLIYMKVGLYRAGVLVAYKYFDSTGSGHLSGQANTACVTGTYTGAADVSVDFPTGYPPEISGTFCGPTVHIIC